MLSTIMPRFILYIAEHGDTNLGAAQRGSETDYMRLN